MMAKLKQLVPLLVLLILGGANGKESKVEIGREAKQFSLFSVVTFPNE